MEKLLGMKWGELAEETREELLSKAAAVDGVTGNTKIGSGECIVDFLGTVLSIPGKVNEELKIEIDDKAVLYTSCAE